MTPPTTPVAFAHRGGAHHPELVGLENTLVAFRHAVALGYTWLETDVHVTADGHLVAFHDPALERVTDGRGAVADLPLAALQEIRVGGREPIPLLAELVEELPGARLNIDLKSDAAVEPLATFLRERGLEDRVIVGSFVERRARAFRRWTDGRVATGATPWEIARFLTLPAALARRGLDPTVIALQVPVRRHGLPITRPALVRRAHAAGRQVHVWTIDDPAEMVRLLDAGVDGIMTDRTDLLRSVLEARGEWVTGEGSA